MPNTYTQIYIQVVFATKGRDIKIGSDARNEIEKYICGIFTAKRQKVLAIYANPDHIHIFFSYKNLQITIPELMKTVRIESTNFINERKLCFGKFSWQEGYGAFSYAKSQKDKVVNYVLNQEKHHLKKVLKKNIWKCWKLLKLNLRKNIFLSFMTKRDSIPMECRLLQI